MVGAWVKSDAGPAGSHDTLRLIAHHWQSSCRHRLEERGGWSGGCAALPEALTFLCFRSIVSFRDPVRAMH